VWCGVRVARLNGKVIQLAYLLNHSELIKARESRCKEVNRALAGKRFAMLRDPSAESNLSASKHIASRRAHGVIFYSSQRTTQFK
jgi:hypothetical protein